MSSSNTFSVLSRWRIFSISKLQISPLSFFASHFLSFLMIVDKSSEKNERTYKKSMFCENINDGIDKHVLFCFESCFDKTYFRLWLENRKTPHQTRKPWKKGKVKKVGFEIDYKALLRFVDLIQRQKKMKRIINLSWIMRKDQILRSYIKFISVLL